MARVVVLHEDSRIQELLALLLTSDAHEISAASTLADASRLALSEGCDLLLIDLPVSRLEELGQERWRLLQEVAGRVPTLICTAWQWATQIEPGELGVADVIAQPFDVDDFRRRVARALGAPRAVSTLV